MTDYHAKMMNVPCGECEMLAYRAGHRDARHACAEIALEAQREIERLRAALSDAAGFPCTCDPAYYERNLCSPDCMADLVSDDAREALGEPPQCRGRAAQRAYAATPEGQARTAEIRAIMEASR